MVKMLLLRVLYHRDGVFVFLFLSFLLFWNVRILDVLDIGLVQRLGIIDIFVILIDSLYRKMSPKCNTKSSMS
jgi:hypothetical protein